jgi:glycosyltransferase involved in cell wall biosynthesis
VTSTAPAGSPSVSVVIPTRDRWPLLAQTLDTVLAQDVDLEVLIVDEASFDDVASRVAELGDERVRVLRHHEPRGVAAARNAGAAATKGAWLAFTDDDDLWAPDKLVRQLDTVVAASSSWSYGGAMNFRAAGPTLLAVHVPDPAAEAHRRLPWHNVVPGGGSGVLVAREAFERVGGFDPRIPISADWDLWIRLAQLADPAVVGQVLVAYRIHDGNMTNRYDEMLASLEVVAARYAHLRGDEAFDWGLHYHWLTQWALRNGDHAVARRFAIAGIRCGAPGAPRHLLRAAVPVPSRDPVDDDQPTGGLLDRIAPRRRVHWPVGARSWLGAALAVDPL